MKAIQVSSKMKLACYCSKLGVSRITCRKAVAATIFCLIFSLTVSYSDTAWALLRHGKSTKIPKKPEGNSLVVAFDMHHRFDLTGAAVRLRYIPTIPKTIKGRQRVIDLRFSPEPIAIYDDHETRYAVFSFGNPRRGLDVHITGEIELYRYDIETAIAGLAGARLSGKTKLSGSERSMYLRAEPFLVVHDPLVRNVAATIKSPSERTGASSIRGSGGQRQAELDTIQGILDWIKKNLQYKEHNDSLRDAARAMSVGKGKCSDFSNVFVTLCRAKGLPAKVVKGLTVYFNNDPTHQWAEVFISGLGWVPFDPTYFRSAFARLRPIYVRQTDIASDARFGIDAGRSRWAWQWKGKKVVDVDVMESYHFYDKGHGGVWNVFR